MGSDALSSPDEIDGCVIWRGKRQKSDVDGLAEGLRMPGTATAARSVQRGNHIPNLDTSRVWAISLSLSPVARYPLCHRKQRVVSAISSPGTSGLPAREKQDFGNEERATSAGTLVALGKPGGWGGEDGV